MKTFHRICIKSEEFTDGERTFKLVRGKEYLTTAEQKGTVTVLSSLWVPCVPVELFAGEEVFTK
jgi:hypothetical protein